MLILRGEGKDFTREVSAEARKLSYFNALGDKHFVNLATRRISLPQKIVIEVSFDMPSTTLI